MDDVVLVGLLQVLGISAVPVVVVLLWTRLPGLWRRLAPHLPRRTPVEQPTHAPLEELAADLRRLYPDVYDPRPGTRMAKQRGVLLAYDEHLAVAAEVLEVDTSLVELPVTSIEREAERMRVEHLLTLAGLVWQVPTRPGGSTGR